MGLFKLETTYDGEVMISTDYDFLEKHSLTLPSGMSYSLLAAHLLGYHVSDYYRMLRDVYGAELWKGQTIWLTARFKKKTSELQKLINKLNLRANEALKTKGDQ